MYERFEQLLEIKGVTAYRVAKDAGVNTATFTTWKNGKHTPTYETMKKIANYFSVPVAYFYEEDPDIIEKYQKSLSIDYVRDALDGDQEQIIKTIASLSEQEIAAIGMFFKALRKYSFSPHEIKAIEMFIKALKGDV